MDLEKYKQVYQAQAMPAEKQKMILGLAGALVGLGGVMATMMIVMSLRVLPEMAVAAVIGVLGYAATVLFGVLGWTVYRLYYVFWCMPLKSATLKVGMAIGATALVATLGLPGVILLIAMFAGVIPRAKLEREQQVRAANGTANGGVTTATGANTAQGAAVAPGTPAASSAAAVSSAPAASSMVMTQGVTVGAPGVVKPYATIKPGRELGIAITLLVFAGLEGLCAIGLTQLTQTAMENNSAYGAAQAFAMMLIFLLFMLVFVGVVAVFVISLLRSRMLVKYQQQEQCRSAMMIHLITKIALVVPVVAFLVAMMYGMGILQ